MASSSNAHDLDPQDQDPHAGSDDEAAMLDANEAEEEILDDGDAAMDSASDGEGEGDDEIMQEIQLQNDSSAHFDLHRDSIFAITQHPVHSHIVATGGSEGGDDESAGGMGYIFDSTPAPRTDEDEDSRPVLPASYQAAPAAASAIPTERKGLEPLFKLEGHTDSINALVFTQPAGQFLLSGGLDGRLRAYTGSRDASKWKFVAEAQEVEEINWLAACPVPQSPSSSTSPATSSTTSATQHPNTIALGASDGSVWVYTIDPTNKAAPLQIVQSYFLHKESCTAGAWSPDGKLLATVSEDGSLYVWDVFGEAAAAGLAKTDGAGAGAYVVGLTNADQRFAVEGGLYSVAVSPTGAFVVVGGAGGSIKVVGLPRLSDPTTSSSATSKSKGSAAKSNTSTLGQAGQILADLQAQSDGIETLAFAPPPLTLMAAGSVDGSIALFDSAHRWAVRRHIKEAHEDFSVVKLEFVRGDSSASAGTASGAGAAVGGGWLLTSCGMDGVVRRWDTRGGTGMANSGFVGEWRGHRGEGEGGGVLGFAQGGDGRRIVTAGDDGVSLVFEAAAP